MHATSVRSAAGPAPSAPASPWSAARAIRQATARGAASLLGLLFGPLAAWVVLLAAALVAAPAWAHELRPAIATLAVQPDGAVELGITLNLEAVMAGIGPEHEDTADSANAPLYEELRALSVADLRAAFAEFEQRFLEGVSLATAEGAPVRLTVTGIEAPEAPDLALARHSEVTLEGRLPEGSAALVWTYDPGFGASVIRLQGGSGDPGGDEVAFSEFVRAGGSSQPITVQGVEHGALQVMANYVEAGFLHVLPLGLDHILFVVGLFLLSPRPRPLLWQVSAFTLAHTITLALGATGVVDLPSAPVEFLIAASIAYVAIENLFTARLHPWRPALVFGFGLLHGLGFAGVLADFGLPEGQFVLALVAFNIGVEVAQLTVIALCFAAVGWAMNRAWYRAGIVAPASLAIAAMAFYWMLERGGLLA